jgi:ADP-heptose:LPS heptosyltransferase
LIGFGPSSQRAEKCWPADRFAATIREIQRRGIGECLLIGAPAERELLETIAREAGTPEPRISSDLGIPALAALLEQCDLYCGNDSGPTHLASALGVRTLAIYFATDPRRTLLDGEHVSVVGPPWNRPPAPRRAQTFWTAGRRRRFAGRRALELSVETVVGAIECTLGVRRPETPGR